MLPSIPLGARFARRFFNTGTRPGQTAASEFLIISAPMVLNAGFSVALIQQAATIGIYKCAPVNTKTEAG